MNKIKALGQLRAFNLVLIALVLVVVGLVSVANSPKSAATGSCTSSATMTLSPSSQSVTVGSNLSVNVIVSDNTAGCSINGASTTVSYPSSLFNYVSFTPGTAFGINPGPSVSAGSVNFSLGSYSAIGNGSNVLATIVLQAKAAGSAPLSFSSICTGTTSSTCSAVTDYNTANQNDLSSTTGGTFTLAAAASGSSGGGTSGGSSGTSSAGSSTKSSGSTSSKSSSKSTTTSGSTSSTTPTTPTSTTTPQTGPKISSVTVSGVGDGQVTVTWTTDVPSTSIVNYGLGANYGLVAQDTTLTTSHKITLSAPNIVTGAKYYFDVSSVNSSGVSTTSSSQQFTTPGFSITIKVHDSSGKPLAGALVTMDNQTVTTNSSGQVTFTNVPAGEQQVVIKDNGKSTKGSVDVGKYNPTTHTYAAQNFSLTASRGGNSYAWILIVALVIIVLIVVMFIAPFPGGGNPFNKMLPPSMRHHAAAAGAGDGAAQPIVVSDPDSRGITPPSASSDVMPPTTVEPTESSSNDDHPDPGSVVPPSQG